MARNDGSNRTVARNRDLTGDAQAHNGRQNEFYPNPDIVPEQTSMNVHFKTPTDSYTEMFDQMVRDGVISTRGLKEDATHFCELIFDVNSAYFFNHGGYEFAKHFYEDAYRAAVDIVGGEQYILSAVMHADERNRAMSEALGQKVFHYHMHVVYVPVVEKQILWSKRCKDPALRGTVKETIMQAAGYNDLERGQRGSTEEHLTVTQFKVQQEQQRLADAQAEIAQLGDEKEQAVEDTRAAQERLHEIAPKVKDIEQKAVDLLHDANKHLPEAGVLESGKAYRDRKALPFVQRMQKIYLALYRKFIDVKSELDELKRQRTQDVSHWEIQARKAQRECEQLRPEATKYRKLCRLLGLEKIEQLLATPDISPPKKHVAVQHSDER